MKDSSFLKITVLMLLCTNIILLAYIWIHPFRTLPDPPRQNSAAEFLTRELKLNAQQQEQFEQLRNEHHHKMLDLQEQGGSLHHQFFELLSKSPADSLAVKRLADSMSANQEQIELLTFEHFKKVRTMCTEEQKKKFDEVIHEAMRMMAPRPPHEPPPGMPGPPK
jgi:protein CpxP